LVLDLDYLYIIASVVF